MDIKQRIGKYVADRVGPAVGDQEDIFALGLADSLFAMQLVHFIEQQFQITVDGDDLDLNNFCSVNAMSAFVSRKLTKDDYGPAP